MAIFFFLIKISREGKTNGIFGKLFGRIYQNGGNWKSRVIRIKNRERGRKRRCRMGRGTGLCRISPVGRVPIDKQTREITNFQIFGRMEKAGAGVRSL